MKYSTAFLAVGASFAAAQSLSDLPACGQVCVTNMINIASAQFGCASGDVKCYCTNSDFGYGIRDCSNESCSADDAAKVISFGTSYCQQALASASVTTGGSALSILSSAAATATQTGGSASAASASSTAITTVPLVATVSASNTVYATTTGFSTVYSQLGATGSLASDASSLSASASSVASSLAASASSVASSLAASASSAASSAASAASSKASSATASGSGSAASSSGLAPRMTAAPILGAAAMGALLFF